MQRTPNQVKKNNIWRIKIELNKIKIISNFHERKEQIRISTSRSLHQSKFSHHEKNQDFRITSHEKKIELNLNFKIRVLNFCSFKALAPGHKWEWYELMGQLNRATFEMQHYKIWSSMELCGAWLGMKKQRQPTKRYKISEIFNFRIFAPVCADGCCPCVFHVSRFTPALCTPFSNRAKFLEK